MEEGCGPSHTQCDVFHEVLCQTFAIDVGGGGGGGLTEHVNTSTVIAEYQTGDRYLASCFPPKQNCPEKPSVVTDVIVD